jgi:zinc transporter ZupT
MDITVLKIITTAATLVIAVLGIVASYKLKKFTKWFDILSAFSGGILIATAYTHMLPEAIEQYDAYMWANYAPAQVATTVAPLQGKANVDPNAPATPAPPAPPAPFKRPRCNHGPGHHHHHRRLAEVAPAEPEHDHFHFYPMIPFLAALSFICLFLVERAAITYMQHRKEQKLLESASTDMYHKTASPTHLHHVESLESNCHSGETCSSNDAHEHAAPNCCKDIQGLESMSELAALALIIAVSLHAVIEGMGMGAASNSDVLMSTFIGIAVHKGLEGFAVGANLIESNVSMRRYIMYSSVVCLASPLGALIGYLMTLADNESSVGLAAPILGALAVGTFIQVATMEFLPRTFAKKEHFTLKSLGLLIGFAVMSTMPLWNEHHH